MEVRKFFQRVSYLQYPLYLVALYFIYRPLFNNLQTIWPDYNSAFAFFGLAIGFASLQDPTKPQNNFSKRIWESPKKSKIMLAYLSTMTGFILLFGLYAFAISENENLNTLSLGVIALGIGLLGMLKLCLEMVTYQQRGNRDQ